MGKIKHETYWHQRNVGYQKDKRGRQYFKIYFN